jgi:hypothetical protein
MWNADSLCWDQIRKFLSSNQPIEFKACDRDENYAWVERPLEAQD